MIDLDSALRRHIYDLTLTRGAPPTLAELAHVASSSAADARASLQRLAAARVVVLQPDSGELLMVPPFSAVPTPFVVETARHTSYANCGWDALGVPVMLRQKARVLSACACCGQAIELDVDPTTPPEGDLVLHIAVPAARWWEDVVFT